MSQDPTARHVTATAPGKVNLSLRVGPPGLDGYHPVATVYLAVSLRETVTAIVRPDARITVAPSQRQVSLVDTADVPWDERNLAHRAAVHLRETLGLEPDTHGVDLEVAKQVPVAGGMGGGSADAAAALLACAALWETGLTRSQLAEIAAPLGADVPFAVMGGAAVGLGTGADLTPVAARRPVHLVLVPADAGLSTPVVFRTLDELRRDGVLTDAAGAPEVNQDVLRALTAADPLDLATAMDNDLQTPAVALFPDLSDMLDLGLDEGALGGMVSGSGPTLLFVTHTEQDALRLATAIQERTGVDALPVRGPVPGSHVL
ncbi:4-(cytidine 5'-diphospho)-2-C-methyl-D-erythritol kinase [Micrococcus sp. M4NT]|uniref:4-(cytidine 5'-diphospho)-2-C-methyl-D-erythritol kinase n=1 Tax=Micrococcus sp. M4NT TaxID=2957501 RepID=UPI0029A8E34D|nr:4-(cytidine 5'-diphospho)-2-C-methyl-D-erythritol kinase [Micrococcus sp. M4NT]MDX2341096.1 4-(cytidine 5'-diphospho)-2-C-methyl-D-erythritol kinase [Micrococcus sp. M4NT]